MLNSCALYNKYNGSTDFQVITKNLVDASYEKMKKNLLINEVVLVSDFVNLSRLENPSRLGFLLSDSLKHELSSKNIIIRQVEFGRDFTIGQHGFKMLTRDQKKINKNTVDAVSYALVGTYMITNKKLIVFVKLIDVETGYILSSSQEHTFLTQEIIELEAVPKVSYSYEPLVL
ncbi:MAG: hypothetical protein HRT40_00825 [Campylobacteraceae bacterium]|nr:hypothetical protein [Campylobacteraceae bacterium]